MLKLNLLPPQTKKELQYNAIASWFIFFSISILINFIIFAVLCLNSYLYIATLINTQQHLIAEQTNSEKFSALEDLESQISQTNQEVLRLYSLQKEFICLTPLLMELAKIDTDGISFNSLTYQTRINNGVITGQADTREHFLEFEEKLKNNNLFTDIQSPLSNVIKKENIDYRLDFKISTSTNSCLN